MRDLNKNIPATRANVETIAKSGGGEDFSITGVTTDEVFNKDFNGRTAGAGTVATFTGGGRGISQDGDLDGVRVVFFYSF